MPLRVAGRLSKNEIAVLEIIRDEGGLTHGWVVLSKMRERFNRAFANSTIYGILWRLTGWKLMTSTVENYETASKEKRLNRRVIYRLTKAGKDVANDPDTFRVSTPPLKRSAR